MPQQRAVVKREVGDSFIFYASTPRIGTITARYWSIYTNTHAYDVSFKDGESIEGFDFIGKDIVWLA